MISIIKNSKELNKYLPQLIDLYKQMFSEKPFNNPNITDEYASIFFNKTLDHGLIFITSKSNGVTLSGFRTLIKSEYFKDYNKLNLSSQSLYLSALYIKPELRGRGLGGYLMEYSLEYAEKYFKRNTFYVRTRADTAYILEVLEKNKFEKISSYPVTINEETLTLTIHKLFAR